MIIILKGDFEYDTILDVFRRCFTTCLNAMESVSYRTYKKKMTIPGDLAHQNVWHSNNQQSQKPGFLIQVKSENKRRSTSDMKQSLDENQYNTVRRLKLSDVFNLAMPTAFELRRHLGEKDRPGAPGGILCVMRVFTIFTQTVDHAFVVALKRSSVGKIFSCIFVGCVVRCLQSRIYVIPDCPSRFLVIRACYGRVCVVSWYRQTREGHCGDDCTSHLCIDYEGGHDFTIYDLMVPLMGGGLHADFKERNRQLVGVDHTGRVFRDADFRVEFCRRLLLSLTASIQSDRHSVYTKC